MSNGKDTGIAAGTEVLVQLIQTLFQEARNAGKTPEEVIALVAEERARFEASDPESIPKV